MEATVSDTRNDRQILVPMLLACVLGFTLLLMANITGAGDFRWRYLLFFMVLALLCAAILFMYFSRSAISADKGFLVTLAVFCGWLALQAVSLAWGESSYGGIQALLLTGCYLSAFALGFLLLRHLEALWLFMGLVVAASVSLCVYGLLQYFFLFNSLVDYMTRLGLDYTITNRVNSRFISPNTFAGFLNIAIPVTIALLLQEKRRSMAWLWGGAFSLQLVCLYLTQSRGGWMVSILLAVLLAAAVPRHRWKPVLKILAVSLLLAASLSWLCSRHDPISNSAYSGKAGEARYENDYSGLDVSAASGSMRGRLGIWRGGLEMFTGHLAGGVGAGSFSPAIQHYQYRSFYSAHAHNYLLEAASENGIGGLLLMLALSLLVLFRIKPAFRPGFDDGLRTFAAALWALMAGFLVHNLIDVSWFNPLTGTVAWLSAGALFAVTAAAPREADPGEEPVQAVRGRRPRPAAAFLLTFLLAAALLASGYLFTLFFLSETHVESGNSLNNYDREQAGAVEEFENALEYYEANPGVHRQLGNLYLGFYKGSEQEPSGEEYSALSARHLDRAIALEPENALGYILKGLLLLNREELEAGRACLEEAQRLYPNNPAPYYFVGESYLEEDNIDMALQEYGKAAELLPFYASESIVPFQQGPESGFILNSFQRMVTLYLYRGEKDRALELIDSALRELPGNGWLHYMRAQVLAEMEEWGQALEEYEKVAVLAPDAVGVYLKMGKAYRQMGDLDKAREMFEKELELHPQYQEAIDELNALTESSSSGGE